MPGDMGTAGAEPGELKGGILLKRAAFAAGFSVLVSLFGVALQWYAVSPIGYGGQFLLWGSAFVVMPLCSAVALVPLSLAGLLIRKLRRLSLTWMVIAAVSLPVLFVGLRCSGRVRMSAFHGLAERSRVLVEAVRRYDADHGRPPASLEALVPRYLPEVPSTGMPAYPEYEYSAGYAPYDWEGNPWVLYVYTPSGGMNFDVFVYFPLVNYPEEGYGGVFERIGDWAYVHE